MANPTNIQRTGGHIQDTRSANQTWHTACSRIMVLAVRLKQSSLCHHLLFLLPPPPTPQITCKLQINCTEKQVADLMTGYP